MRPVYHQRPRNVTDAKGVKFLQNWLECLQQDSSSEKCRWIKIRKNTLCLQFAKLFRLFNFRCDLPKTIRKLYALQLQSSSEPCTGRCFGIQLVNWHLSYTQIATFVLKIYNIRHSRSYPLIDCCAETPHLLVGAWVWLSLIQFTAFHIKIHLL